MDPIQRTQIGPVAPAAAPTSSPNPPGGFAALLRELEQAGNVPATTETLDSTLATAEDAFELAMRLRSQLEQAFRTYGSG